MFKKRKTINDFTRAVEDLHRGIRELHERITVLNHHQREDHAQVANKLNFIVDWIKGEEAENE